MTSAGHRARARIVSSDPFRERRGNDGRWKRTLKFVARPAGVVNIMPKAKQVLTLRNLSVVGRAGREFLYVTSGRMITSDLRRTRLKRMKMNKRVSLFSPV